MTNVPTSTWKESELFCYTADWGSYIPNSLHAGSFFMILVYFSRIPSAELLLIADLLSRPRGYKTSHAQLNGAGNCHCS